MNIDSVNRVQYLPDELITHIFSYLDVGDLAASQVVNSRWKQIGGDHTLWKRLADFYDVENQKNSILNRYTFSFCNSEKLIRRLTGESCVSDDQKIKAVDKMSRDFVLESVWEEIRKRYSNHTEEWQIPADPNMIKRSELQEKCFLKGISLNNTPFILFIVNRKKDKKKVFLTFQQIIHYRNTTSVEYRIKLSLRIKTSKFQVRIVSRDLLTFVINSFKLHGSTAEWNHESLWQDLKCLISEGRAKLPSYTIRNFQANLPVID